MAKKSNKAAGVAVAVGGVAALGLAAYALSQSKGDGQKEASQMLSGGYGGGATGGYSDAFTDVTTPNTQPNISDTVGAVLKDVFTTTQQPQQSAPTFIINPQGNDNIEPTIQPIVNPSDEKSDIKQGDTVGWVDNWAGVPYKAPETDQKALNSVAAGLATGEYSLINRGGSLYIEPTNTAVEYSPFDFAPTPKQADYSSYNAGKTGGSAANTPKADNSNTGKTSDNRSQSAGAQALTSSLSNGTAKTGKQTMQVTSPVSTALNAAGQAFSAGVSAVGSFISGLFGGK